MHLHSVVSIKKPDQFLVFLVFLVSPSPTVIKINVIRGDLYMSNIKN